MKITPEQAAEIAWTTERFCGRRADAVRVVMGFQTTLAGQMLMSDDALVDRCIYDAERNGMSVGQAAATRIVNRPDVRANAEACAVLADKTTALPALSRVALLMDRDETNEDRGRRIINAILS